MTDDFYEIALPLPTHDEQERIVTFIAAFDRGVNRLIRAKRRLIELLNEQNQGIFHRAVTRGLDRSVRLKHSGIDWLGDVPEPGSTRGALTCEGIRRFKVVLPPADEQDRLVSWLKRDLADVEATIARIRHEMDLVGEYRTRLIADVVTGKLDVRGVELPTLDGGEPIDDALAGEEEAGEVDLDAATEDAARAPEE